MFCLCRVVLAWKSDTLLLWQVADVIVFCLFDPRSNMLGVPPCFESYFVVLDCVEGRLSLSLHTFAVDH